MELLFSGSFLIFWLVRFWNNILLLVEKMKDSTLCTDIQLGECPLVFLSLFNRIKAVSIEGKNCWQKLQIWFCNTPTASWNPISYYLNCWSPCLVVRCLENCCGSSKYPTKLKYLNLVEWITLRHSLYQYSYHLTASF